MCGVNSCTVQMGGGCGCNLNRNKFVGGGCGCNLERIIKGGYRPTKRNLYYLKKWKRGESIGFTMRSSLKAKGLIPRANGTKRVSPKYR